MGNFNKKIFGKKKFSDILEEIYDNSKKKEEQISVLISELRPLVKDIGDATLIVPLSNSLITLKIASFVSDFSVRDLSDQACSIIFSILFFFQNYLIQYF